MNSIMPSTQGQMTARPGAMTPNTPADELRQMYPDIYTTMYPIIQQVIDAWVNTHPWANKVTEEDLEMMVQKVLETLGILEEPPASGEEIAEVFRPVRGGIGGRFPMNRVPYRDLSRIFLINGLLTRRNPYYYYPYPCSPYDPYCPYYY